MRGELASACGAFSGERAIALVTGGAKRVGRAVCLELGRRGVDVLLTYASSGGAAEETRREVAGLGVTAGAVRLELGEPGEVGRWAGELAGALPRLDVLVHNASVYEPTAVGGGLDVGLAVRQMAVNALSPLALSAGLAGLLAESELEGGGAIVAMLDIHAEGQPRRDHSAYSMSKAALAGMVRSLAVDLGPRVRVNGVAPGVVAWPESGRDADAGMQARYLARVPLGRAGTPGDAAGAVVYLALDARYTTGSVLAVDGGRGLR